jgi:hypothetical protein
MGSNNTYKIAVVARWFGNQLPGYFPCWFISAAANKSIDFYFYTDQEVLYRANNIHIVKTTLAAEVAHAAQKLQRPVEVTQPYKMCDLRPFIGVIYEDVLASYDFWGFCDIDMAFGDIRSFVTDEILEKHNRIYEFGHLNLYRNSKEINHLFEKDGAIYSLDEALCGPHVSFTEHFGITRICKKNNISNYTSVDFGDFQDEGCLVLFHGFSHYERQLFYWENGHTYRAYVEEDGETVRVEEFVYFHWGDGINPIPTQKVLDNLGRSFTISTHSIDLKKDGVLNAQDIPKAGRDSSRLKGRRLRKIKKFFAMPSAAKRIKLRQMRYWLTESKQMRKIRLGYLFPK